MISFSASLFSSNVRIFNDISCSDYSIRNNVVTALYSAELYPTIIRSTAVGSCSLMARYCVPSPSRLLH